MFSIWSNAGTQIAATASKKSASKVSATSESGPQPADDGSRRLRGFESSRFALVPAQVTTPSSRSPTGRTTKPRARSRRARTRRARPSSRTAARTSCASLRGVKTTGQCPKCQGRKTYQIREVKQTNCDAKGTLRSFDVTAGMAPTGGKTRPGWWRAQGPGRGGGWLSWGLSSETPRWRVWPGTSARAERGKQGSVSAAVGPLYRLGDFACAEAWVSPQRGAAGSRAMV